MEPATSSSPAVDPRAELYCPACGYHLRGTVSECCPECGTSIDEWRPARIPWEHRATLGRARAFWSTVEFAVRDSRGLALEVGRLSGDQCAVDFPREAVRWASLSLVPPAAYIGLTLGRWMASGNGLGGALATVIGVLIVEAVPLISFWGLLNLAARVPSLLLKMAEVSWFARMRAGAAGCYAAAPLALLPVGSTVLTAALAVQNELVLPSWPSAVAVLVGLVQWLVAAAMTASLAVSIPRGSRRRHPGVRLGLSLGWLVLAAMYACLILGIACVAELPLLLTKP